MISFIVPAHNEQACLGRTLRAIHESARSVGQPYEIVVVDDASTDATAEIAKAHNAIVVTVNHRQIAATRNSGARAARGERLFFVDADTTINPRAVTAALHAMDRGAAGGGAGTRFEDSVPFYARLGFFGLFLLGKIVGFTGGALMFCTRAAFLATGGFDERFYAAEELGLAFALKRIGPFVVLWRRVLTSGRRLRNLSGLQVLALFRMAFRPFRTLTRREAVQKIWYDSDRGRKDAGTGSVVAHVSNSLALLIIVVLFTQPVWMLVTTCWPHTLAGPMGTIRRTGGLLTSHVALLYWPFALFLFRALLQQTRWAERLKLIVLIAICLRGAWTGTLSVIWIWSNVFRWLAT